MAKIQAKHEGGAEDAPVEQKPKKEKKAKKESAEPKTAPSSKWVKIEEDGVSFFHNTIDNTVWDINEDSPTEQIGTWNLTTKSIDYIEM